MNNIKNCFDYINKKLIPSVNKKTEEIIYSRSFQTGFKSFSHFSAATGFNYSKYASDSLTAGGSVWIALIPQMMLNSVAMHYSGEAISQTVSALNRGHFLGRISTLPMTFTPFALALGTLLLDTKNRLKYANFTIKTKDEIKNLPPNEKLEYEKRFKQYLFDQKIKSFLFKTYKWYPTVAMTAMLASGVALAALGSYTMGMPILLGTAMYTLAQKNCLPKPVKKVYVQILPFFADATALILGNPLSKATVLLIMSYKIVGWVCKLRLSAYESLEEKKAFQRATIHLANHVTYYLNNNERIFIEKAAQSKNISLDKVNESANWMGCINRISNISKWSLVSAFYLIKRYLRNEWGDKLAEQQVKYPDSGHYEVKINDLDNLDLLELQNNYSVNKGHVQRPLLDKNHPLCLQEAMNDTLEANQTAKNNILEMFSWAINQDKKIENAILSKWADDENRQMNGGSYEDPIQQTKNALEEFLNSVMNETVISGTPIDYELNRIYIRLISKCLLEKKAENSDQYDFSISDVFLQLGIDAGNYCGPRGCAILEEVTINLVMPSQHSSIEFCVLKVLQNHRKQILDGYIDRAIQYLGKQRENIRDAVPGIVPSVVAATLVPETVSIDLHDYHGILKRYGSSFGLTMHSANNDQASSHSEYYTNFITFIDECLPLALTNFNEVLWGESPLQDANKGDRNGYTKRSIFDRLELALASGEIPAKKMTDWIKNWHTREMKSMHPEISEEQLNENFSDWFAEVTDETYVPHHPKLIALLMLELGILKK